MDVRVEDIPQSEEPSVPTQAQTGVQDDPVSHLSIARRFNIDIPTKEEDGKLKEVWEHAASLSESGDIQDIIWQVINMENKLGSPRLGESRLDKLYRYAKLIRQQKMVETELKEVAGV